MNLPLVSVIMPVYNSSEFLRSSLECILNQTYTNFEFIIIDDGSSDNTSQIIESYSDTRIKYIKSEHKGFIYQLNYGLEISKGEFIARMDGDDLTHLERFEKEVEILTSDKTITLVGTNFYYVNHKGKILQSKNFPEFNEDIEFMMPVIPSILHGSMMVYKSALIDVGGYDPDNFSEDPVLFMKLLSAGFKMYNIQEFLYSYRIVNKPEVYYRKHFEDYYKYSVKYLNKLYQNKKELEVKSVYNYRRGLVEYYIGKPSESRKYFKECLHSHDISKLSVLRYYLISYLGNELLDFIRKKNIAARINFLIHKIFKIDTNKILKPKKGKVV